MHPPFSFPTCGKENGPCTVQKKRPLGRAPVQWPSARNGGRRIGACSDLDWPSGTLCSSAIPVAAVPWRMAPTSSGWLSHGAASLFATAHAPAKNPAARSAAERAEREADQMRPCTPLTFAPAPRESAFKPVPHPAAPVGRSSQTRRHHLSSTPVQQLCTDVQSCDQKRFFSYTGRGAFSFGARPKGAPAAPRAVGRGGARERAQFSPQAETELSRLCDDAMGAHPPWNRPLREQNLPGG